jgi:TIR domain
MADQPRLFISYSRGDKEFARELSSLLERRGLSVFLDANDIRPGEDWGSVLRNEVTHSSAMVLLIPSFSNSDRNDVWFEAGVARALGKQVVAVLPPVIVKRVRACLQT